MVNITFSGYYVVFLIMHYSKLVIFCNSCN